MRDDDEILDAYERELEREREPAPRGSKRGFWLVFGALAIASIVLVVEIFANRPIATSIGHAQFDLRQAQAHAIEIRDSTGSFAGADARAITRAGLHEGNLAAVGPDEVSGELDEVSVYADETTWAAAVSARPNACFYLKLAAGQDAPLYGSGTTCTAREALTAATGSRW